VETLVDLQVPKRVYLTILNEIKPTIDKGLVKWDGLFIRFNRQYELQQLVANSKLKTHNSLSFKRERVLLLSVDFLGSWKEKFEFCLLSKEDSQFLLPNLYKGYLLTTPVIGDVRFQMWKYILSRVH